MNAALIVAALKYIAAHAAGFGGLITAVVLVVQGHYNEALTALLAALAGFGVMIKPQQQVTTAEIAKAEERRAA